MKLLFQFIAKILNFLKSLLTRQSFTNKIDYDLSKPIEILIENDSNLYNVLFKYNTKKETIKNLILNNDNYYFALYTELKCDIDNRTSFLSLKSKLCNKTNISETLNKIEEEITTLIDYYELNYIYSINIKLEKREYPKKE